MLGRCTLPAVIDLPDRTVFEDPRFPPKKPTAAWADEAEREEPWMTTCTGVRFHFMGPRLSEFRLEDIARSLSRQCRYNGHLRDDVDFYSVAEHSVHVADWLWDWYGDTMLARQGLMHDLSETYITDVVRPVKPFLGNYHAIKNAIMAKGLEAFGMLPRLDDRVKQADNRILLDERAAVMLKTDHVWEQDGLEPLGVRILALPPSRAYDMFKNAYARYFHHV